MMAPNNSKKQQTITSKSGSWVDGSSFPYPVDYNDHFETPAAAYRDLRPVLDWLTSSSSRHSIPIGQTLYDPYYCNGRAKDLLHEIGYDQVVHEKRDFYADVENGTVPAYDIFITNPPYSDEHKSKCIDYCCTTMQQQQTKQQQQYKPFFLLMPAYVATKQYMRSALPNLFFLIPSVEYQYHHPDDTGKDITPFSSLWYCGVGAARVDACVQHLLSLSSSSSWRLAKSLPELADLKMIRLQNRLNPRQRRKQQRQRQPAHSQQPPQQQQQQQLLVASIETPAAVAETTEPVSTTSENNPSLTSTRKNKAGEVDNGGSHSSGSHSSSGNNDNKKTKTTTKPSSKYRDPMSGQRKRQRF
jgi:hypothetical protein